jgi:ABC-type transport system involved in multi-copper enzyme maturation permease subunit
MTPGIPQDYPLAAPSANNDWLSHTWRLVRWNLKLARRRLMSKILLAILLVGFLLVAGFLVLTYLFIDSASRANVSAACPTPVATSQTSETSPGSGQASCNPNTAQEQQSLQTATNEELQILSFPTILGWTGGYTGFMGIILLCTLAGAVVGGEYSFGTQRLALSRGASRAQVLAGQVGALAILALGTAGMMLIIGTLTGFTLGPALGATLSGIGPDGALQILAFWLVTSLHLFAYALIALLLATLGRSTAAGIAGSLGYVLFEAIALGIISTVALVLVASGSAFGDVLNHVQDFFLGPNLSGLLSGIDQSPLDLGGGGSSASAASAGGLTPYVIPPLQGLIASILYCVLLVGLSYWVLRKRDVTH